MHRACAMAQLRQKCLLILVHSQRVIRGHPWSSWTQNSKFDIVDGFSTLKKHRKMPAEPLVSKIDCRWISDEDSVMPYMHAATSCQYFMAWASTRWHFSCSSVGNSSTRA
mgnify:CR=1 FL=1